MDMVRDSSFVPPELRDFLSRHDIKIRVASGHDLPNPQAIMIQERGRPGEGDTIVINETYLLAELAYLQSVMHVDRGRAELVVQGLLLPLVVQELGELHTDARIVEKVGVRPPDFSERELLGLFWQAESVESIAKNRESFERTFGSEVFGRLGSGSVYGSMMDRFLEGDENPDGKTRSDRVRRIHRDLYGNEASVFGNWQTEGKRSEIVAKVTSASVNSSSQRGPEESDDDYKRSIYRWIDSTGLSPDGLRALNSVYEERTQFFETYAGTKTQQRVTDCYKELIEEAKNR